MCRAKTHGRQLGHRQAGTAPLNAASPTGGGGRCPPIEERIALVEIKPLSSVEPAAVEALLDRAFGADRFGRTAYQLRRGTHAIAALSFAAFASEQLVGTLQSWPVLWQPVNAAPVAMVMVGPVAVQPHLQRGGIGRAMMAQLINAAEQQAHGALMMIGDPEYYGRFFGFAADATALWQLPGPVERHRLLARAANGHAVPAGAGAIVPDLRADVASGAAPARG